MSFNEALAWFGMTALATGLFIIFDRHLRTVWSVLLAAFGLVAIAYAVYQHNVPSAPKLPELWIMLLAFTWTILGYDIYQHKKAPVPATGGGLSATTSGFAGNLSPLHIPGPGSGSGRSVEFTTFGTGDQEIDLGVRPRKLLFEPGGIVGEGDLEKSLQVFGHEVTIRRFTNRGFVVNDNEERLTVKVSVLESVPSEELEAQVAGAKQHPTKDEIRQFEIVGALRHYVWDIGELNKALEEVQDLYANDKSTPEEILLPLSKSAIPDEIQKWKHRKLLEFRIAYRQHIAGVKQADPDFHSKLVDEGFPCEGQTDREVIRKIERHNVALMERIDRLSKPSTS